MKSTFLGGEPQVHNVKTVNCDTMTVQMATNEIYKTLTTN